MIKIKDHKTKQIFDFWSYLGPKRRKLLDESWAGLFREEILPNLPVADAVEAFREDFGRPTKELYASLGLLVLQEMLDMTDQETIDQFAFNVQWHYALDITDESDEGKYMCAKTLWNIRNLTIERGISDKLFAVITDNLAQKFAVDSSKQRIDSVHVRSNMARLGRITIFVKTIHKFLVNLKRHYSELYGELNIELVERYISKKALQVFSQVKPSESAKTLKQVSEDLWELLERFKENQDVKRMNSYQLISRVFSERCSVVQDSEGKEIEIKVKPSEAITGGSLQNPSDPDAGYNSHKGEGYAVQVMETYTLDNDEETLNLITYAEANAAHHSDAGELLPAIDEVQERGLGPEEVLGDSLYGSDENCQAAAEKGVEVISPVLGEQKKKIKMSDFEYSEDWKILHCPEGHEPVRGSYTKNNCRVTFGDEACGNCPRYDECPVMLKGRKTKRYVLDCRAKTIRLAERRIYEQTDEFAEKYRFRSGIEATMSELDRRTRLKHLRVRGLKSVRYCVKLKALGINILRAAAVRKARTRRTNASVAANTNILFSFRPIILIVKAHFEKIMPFCSLDAC